MLGHSTPVTHEVFRNSERMRDELTAADLKEIVVAYAHDLFTARSD